MSSGLAKKEEAVTLRWEDSDVVRRSHVPATRQTHDTLHDGDAPVDALKEQALGRIGRVLADRWELRNLLGCGSAGAVYSAYDLVRDQRVAVKVLHDGLNRSREHVARFEQEARAASAIGHSSVVEIFEVGRDEKNRLFMVLELLEGEALFYAIEAGRLSTSDILEIGRQLLGALAAAHARGVVHRDVKPENLFLVHERSGALRLKLLDFGIAKYLAGDDRNAFSTMDGMLLGTPHYMSPQLVQGQPADAGTDLWAAGAVLFHALSGEPPFDEDNIGKLLIKVAAGRAPSLAEKRPDLPRALTAAIDRALHPDPEKRWRSALAFSDALTVGGADIDGLDWDDDP